MEGVRRYVRTLRHLKAWQVVGRLVAPVRRQVATWRLPSPPSHLQKAWQPSTAFPHHDPWNTREELVAGQFRFLDEEASLGRPVDWTASDQPLLWKFNLHYFNYLHLLRRDEQVDLCREWVAAHPVGEGVGWHPYPTALRLVNWCKAEFGASDLLESLYQQAAYLYRNLETHVFGNHLLENARALVLAGCYLKGQGEADQWLECGLKTYRKQTPEQILPDGMHYERSPMYHALMLEGYLDVLNVLPAAHPDRIWLRRAAQKMTDVLAAVTHPDGTLALFNDSTHEIAPPSTQVVQYARDVLGYAPGRRAACPEAGYYVVQDDDLWMMVDGGPAGPDYLMAHAHADIFSYELSLYGRRFIVDSGVYEYAAGSMRQYARGTAAHNTLQVDGLDQVECWDSFRVARRAAPHDVQWTKTDGGAAFEGVFGGYQNRLGEDIRHRRRIEIDLERQSIQVNDLLTGGGEHRAESRIHFHPKVDVRREGKIFYIERNGKQCRIEVQEGTVRRGESWYCPRFGVRHRNCVLVIGESASLPIQLAYRIQY